MFEKIKSMSKKSQNIKVLYVEDDSIARKHTGEFLSTFFENLITATNGREGIEKFSENTPIDLVITDINMPKLNGIEMIKEIKKIDPYCFFIVLTQHDESHILLETMYLNIDEYILKPVSFENIVISIEKVITKIQMKYQLENTQTYLDQYLSLIDRGNIISKTDTKGNITFVNESFCKISGYTKKELIGKKHSILRDKESPDELYADLWNTIKVQKKSWEGVIKNRSKNGMAYYIRTMITPIKDKQNNIVEYISIRDNLDAIINDKKHLFEKIEENELSILAIVQIDEFDILEKFYNITLVDQIEKYFAFHLLSYLPEIYKFENIYSLGDGRFALLTNFDNFNLSKIEIDAYFHAFTKNIFQESFNFNDIDFEFSITLSYTMGKYMLYEDAKEGLENAIKEKTQVHFANDSSIIAFVEAKKNLDMIKTVKIALDNFKIVSYFQPIINNQTKRIDKYESLVRLIDEEGKVLSPFHFLNIAKTGNYYNKITQRVLENSFKILHSIRTKISINISSLDIEKEELRIKIFELLDQYKEDSNRIIFEILEDENMKNFEEINFFISEVKKRGVQIAIDDFGAGYSNFERILKFQPDIIKIDGSLIKNIVNDTSSRDIVETMVLFAKKQNIETIAEFVENEDIFNILHEIGVDYSQGYYFGKPKEMS